MLVNFLTPPFSLQHIDNQRDVTAFYNILDKKNNRTKNSKNCTRDKISTICLCLCKLAKKKFIGRGQRQLSKTRPWDIRKFHTHASAFVSEAAAAVWIPEGPGVE